MISKADLRKAARAQRKMLAHPDIAAMLAAHAAALQMTGGIVGGYHAFNDEADPALLLTALEGAGCTIAFPRITDKGAALEFHLVPGGESLAPATHGIHEPSAHWPLVVPNLVLVPLLAFDDTGHRLGYGGGYYDRTLSYLRLQNPQLRAIGIAYAGQLVPSLPSEAHDMALDGVLTEQGLKAFR